MTTREQQPYKRPHQPIAHLMLVGTERLYDRLHYLPSLRMFSGNKQLLSICKDFGMEIPSPLSGRKSTYQTV